MECRACKLEEESQKHILKCKILNPESDQELNYEKIFNGTVSEKLKIARRFKRNKDRLEIENFWDEMINQVINPTIQNWKYIIYYCIHTCEKSPFG